MSAFGSAPAFTLGLMGVGVALLMAALLWGNLFSFAIDTSIWENLAPFTPVSGQRTFERYVAYPIPTQLSDLKTEKNSYNVGEMVTFTFTGNPRVYPFIKDWRESREGIPLYGIEKKFENGVVRVYSKELPDSRNAVYLVFNMTQGRGYFFAPEL